MYDFKDIIGNENIILNLKNSIVKNRVNHAYLFEGDDGAGKMLLAQSFAKAMQCQLQLEDAQICDKCSSCLSFDSYNNPDIIYVKPTKTKTIGVDDIRLQVNKEMSLKPYQYKYKIFIIENADTMTPAAQNALLKTLEEPSSYGVFLLLATNFNLLLPTVLSRCFTVKIKPLSFDLVKNYLIDKMKTQEDRADFISVYASGSIGRALTFAEDAQFMQMREKVIDILDRIDQKDLVDVFLLAKEFEPMKDNMDEVLNIAFLWYRDIMILKELKNSSLILQKDIKERLAENEYMSKQTLYKNIDALWDAKMNLRYNANFQLTTENLLMKLNA